MRAICLLIALVASVLFSSVGLAIEYWPTDYGVEYLYVNSEGSELRVTFTPWGMTKYSYGTMNGDCYTTYRFTVGDDGDLYATGLSSFCSVGVDPNEYPFTPDIVYLDLPLEVGKSWSDTYYQEGAVDVWQYGVTCEHTVVEETQVTVPAGTFSVKVLQVDTTYYWPPAWYLRGTLYLHVNLGPVILPGGWELAEYSGVVATEDMTWDEVKALYR